MIYLILPRGSQFGWGICGKYLVKELSELAEIKYITEAFDLNDIGDELDFHFLKSKYMRRQEIDASAGEPGVNINHPVLKAITDESLKSWLTDL